MTRVNVTLNRPLLEEVDEIARLRLEDRSTAIRQLLSRAIQEERIVKAMELYKRKKITLRQAAKLAKLDYWEFQDEMWDRGLALMFSPSVAEEGMRYVEEKLRKDGEGSS